LRVFRLIKQLQPAASFLAITTQPAPMRQAMERFGLAPADAVVVSVDPADVPRHLAAADAGLLLRASNVTNRVASPVKFGEYLAAGVPVIVSEGVGDYSAAVRRCGLGEVVELSQSDEQLKRQLHEALFVSHAFDGAARERCREYAAEELSWRRCSAVLHEVFQQAAS
jgi:glycosyltransferase involved in cell wall biosynthesis